jgi:hypothetical protein
MLGKGISGARQSGSEVILDVGSGQYEFSVDSGAEPAASF